MNTDKVAMVRSRGIICVATQRGLMRIEGKGEVSNGLITKPFSASLPRSTTSGSFNADCRFLQIKETLGRMGRQAKNLCISPLKTGVSNLQLVAYWSFFKTV